MEDKRPWFVADQAKAAPADQVSLSGYNDTDTEGMTPQNMNYFLSELSGAIAQNAANKATKIVTADANDLLKELATFEIDGFSNVNLIDGDKVGFLNGTFAPAANLSCSRSNLWFQTQSFAAVIDLAGGKTLTLSGDNLRGILKIINEENGSIIISGQNINLEILCDSGANINFTGTGRVEANGIDLGESTELAAILAAFSVPNIAGLSSLQTANKNLIIGGNIHKNPMQRGEQTVEDFATNGLFLADRLSLTWGHGSGGTTDPVVNFQIIDPELTTKVHGVWCKKALKITVTNKNHIDPVAYPGSFLRLSQKIAGVESLSELPARHVAGMEASGIFDIPVSLIQNFGTSGSPSVETPATNDFVISAANTMTEVKTGWDLVPSMNGKIFGTANTDYLELAYDLTKIPDGGHIIIPLVGPLVGGVQTPLQPYERVDDVLWDCLPFGTKFRHNITVSGEVGQYWTQEVRYKRDLRRAPDITDPYLDSHASITNNGIIAQTKEYTRFQTYIATTGSNLWGSADGFADAEFLI